MSLPETVVLAFNQGIDANSMGDMIGTSRERTATPLKPCPRPSKWPR